MPLADPGHAPSFRPDAATMYGRHILIEQHHDHEERVRGIKSSSDHALDNTQSRMSREYAAYRRQPKNQTWRPDGYRKLVLEKNERAHNELLMRSTAVLNPQLDGHVELAWQRMKEKGVGPTAQEVLAL